MNLNTKKKVFGALILLCAINVSAYAEQSKKQTIDTLLPSTDFQLEQIKTGFNLKINDIKPRLRDFKQ